MHKVGDDGGGGGGGALLMTSFVFVTGLNRVSITLSRRGQSRRNKPQSEICIEYCTVSPRRLRSVGTVLTDL